MRSLMYEIGRNEPIALGVFQGLCHEEAGIIDERALFHHRERPAGASS